MFPRQRPLPLFCPQLEPLSDRIVPSGMVYTSFNGGTLTIFSAKKDGADKQIELLGASEGFVSIVPMGGETIKRHNFNLVTKVVVKLGNGNDTVDIVNLKLAKSGETVRFAGGTGNNILQFDGTSINIRNLDVTNGVATGTGTFSIMDKSASVQKQFGTLSINCPGKGADTIQLQDTTVSGTTKVVTGTKKALPGKGNDLVQIDNATFTGKFTLLTRAGNDNVEIGTSSSAGLTVTFNAAVRIDVGKGTDTLRAGGMVAPGNSPDAVNFMGKATFIHHLGSGNGTLNVLFPFNTTFAKEGTPVLIGWA